MTSQFTKQIAQKEPGFDFVAAHFQCETNRYSLENPDGFVNLGSAQNYLHPELLGDRLAFVEGHPDDAHYQAFNGTSDCRASIANYLSSHSETHVSNDSIVVGNGIISILEALTIALLDEGDSVLIPTPVFPGLVAAMSLRVRSKVELMETDASSGFRLTPAALETHLHQLKFEGKRVRAILICSPGNPVGQVFSADELAEFLEIAEMFDCALIVDEVYAGSVFSGDEFVSAVSLESKNVYVLGGLSKDFGLAGHATGWLHSINQDVVTAVAKQAHFFRLPAPIQRIITAVLQPKWRDDYLTVHRQKLKEAERVARQELTDCGVPVVASEAGLCLWVDLHAFLDADAADAEMKLYERLLNDHRVHISPGSGFKSTARGYFRLCFSQPPEILLEGLKRLIEGLIAGPSVPQVSTQAIENNLTNVSKTVLS
jgi:aspartate/methionine/tyrosine aminotransferase